MVPFFDDLASSRHSLTRCLRGGNTTIVLIGDSRMRQLYFYLQATLSVPRTSLDEISFKAHSDLNVSLPLDRGASVTVLFFWEAKLSSDRTAALLLRAGRREGAGGRNHVLVVQGAGLWELKAEVERPELVRALVALRDPMISALRDPRVALYWLPMGGLIWDMLVQPRQTITNRNISWVDAQARTLFGPHLTFLEQVVAIYRGTGPEGTADGLHYSEKVGILGRNACCRALPRSGLSSSCHTLHPLAASRSRCERRRFTYSHPHSPTHTHTHTTPRRSNGPSGRQL
jgi:hypothetical protein